jgi:hypothetical protein
MNDHKGSQENEEGRAHGRSRKRWAETQVIAPQVEPAPAERRINDAPVQPAETKSPLDAMYPQLVRDSETPEQKLMGFLAYGLYEEARREWASDFRDREGRYPAEDELRAYERSWTASRLDGIRNAAVQLVAAYADAVVNQIESDILRRALKGQFWGSVGRWLFR